MKENLESLRAYLILNRHVYNLSAISVKVFKSHKDLLSNFIYRKKNGKKFGLGEKEQEVLDFFSNQTFEKFKTNFKGMITEIEKYCKENNIKYEITYLFSKNWFYVFSEQDAKTLAKEFATGYDKSEHQEKYFVITN